MKKILEIAFFISILLQLVINFGLSIEPVPSTTWPGVHFGSLSPSPNSEIQAGIPLEISGTLEYQNVGKVRVDCGYWMDEGSPILAPSQGWMINGAWEKNVTGEMGTVSFSFSAHPIPPEYAGANKMVIVANFANYSIWSWWFDSEIYDVVVVPLTLSVTVYTDKGWYDPGDTVVIEGSVTSNGVVEGAYVSIRINGSINGEHMEWWLGQTVDSTGTYRIEFKTSSRMLGEYYVKVTASKQWYQDGTASTSFTIQEAQKKFTLALTDTSLDVYPTECNVTTVEVNYFPGLDLTSPIRLKIEDSLPPGLNVTFDPEEMKPSASGLSSSELNVTLNCSKAKGLKLPAEHKLTVTASSGDHKDSKDLTLHLLPAKWLVMLYLVADTTPDLELGMLYNVEEMLNVSRKYGTPKVGMTVLIDLRYSIVPTAGIKYLDVDKPKTPKWNSPFATWRQVPFRIWALPGNNAQLYQVVKGNLTKIGKDWGATNMSSIATLKRFVNESMNKIPAEHNHLIISDHGGGIRGIAWDYHQGDKPLKFSPMASAFKSRKFDVLSFDACLMAQVELLYHLRAYADYFTCSELAIPNKGYAYNQFLADLSKKPDVKTLDYVKCIVRSYGSRYDGSKAPLINQENATLSAIDSSKLKNLTSAIDAFAKALSACYLAHDAAFNKTVAEDAFKSWEADVEPYTDIRDFAQNIIDDPKITDKKVKDAAGAVVKAVDAAVVANNVTYFLAGNPIQTGYYGLTIFLWRCTFLPWLGKYVSMYGYEGSAGDVYRHYLGLHRETAFAKATAWQGFLNDFVHSLPGFVTTITLHHPGHQLYLHIYDPEGRHIGFNPSRKNESRTQLDLQIPDALYIDFRNGTTVILLPTSVTQFRTVVDGYGMEEAEEPYTLTYTVVMDGKVTDTKTLENVIEQNTAHSTPIKLEDGELIIGKTSGVSNVQVVDHLLCKSVSDEGKVEVVTTTFSPQDQVYSWLTLANASVGDRVWWLFQGPNGITEEYTYTLDWDGEGYCWAPLDLNGYSMEDAVGDWSVTVTINGVEAFTDQFTVEPLTGLVWWAPIIGLLIIAVPVSLAIIFVVILINRRKT